MKGGIVSTPELPILGATILRYSLNLSFAVVDRLLELFGDQEARLLLAKGHLGKTSSFFDGGCDDCAGHTKGVEEG